MLDALKFVQGSIAKTGNGAPVLTHFLLNEGRVTGFNGLLSLSAPIALDLRCCPKAQPFVNAIEQCRDTIQLQLSAKQKLNVRSGAFRVAIDCLDADHFPDIQPVGQGVALSAPILPILRTLFPFISEQPQDASDWSAGLLLDGSVASACNRVVLVQHLLPCAFPYRVNLPRATVREMLRIAEEPTSFQLTADSITVHYSEGRWLRSQLHQVDWIDVSELFQNMPSAIDSLPPGFSQAIDTIRAFLNPKGLLELNEQGMHADTASVGIACFPPSYFNADALSLAASVADAIHFASYPRPCPFRGANLRGAIIGMRP